MGTPNGYWTLGFIENPNKPTVVWGDEMDEIVEELWADGQPDGPKEGTMGSIEFCVAVQQSQTHRKLAKLHDKLCIPNCQQCVNESTLFKNTSLSFYALIKTFFNR